MRSPTSTTPTSTTTPTRQPVRPADDRLYPAGSPYNGDTDTQQPKPRVLLIDIASVWCGPCNEEAKSEFPGLYAKYKPCGGQFLFQLAQGAGPGTPATERTSSPGRRRTR